MASRRSNLIRRGDTFYYRASFTLDGKISEIRLSLKTGDRRIARQRAAQMDRLLKNQWQRLSSMNDPISEADRLSILREGAVKERDAFEQLFAEEQHEGYDDAEEVQQENLRTLRSMDMVARDIFAHGMGLGFGSHDHFHARFVEGMPGLSLKDGTRVMEILEAADELRAAIQEGANKALLRRNLEVTPANLTVARQQMLLGVVLAMRDRQKSIAAPDAQIDDMLASLSLDALTASARQEAYATTAPASTPAAPSAMPATAQTPASTAVPGASRMSIRQAADALLAANPRLDADGPSSRWTPKTRTQFDAAIFLAEKHFGPAADIRQIDENQIAGLFRVLRKLPPSHHKTPTHSGMTLEAIAQINSGAGLSLATTNRHMRFLKTVFRQPRPLASRPMC